MLEVGAAEHAAHHHVVFEGFQKQSQRQAAKGGKQEKKVHILHLNVRSGRRVAGDIQDPRNDDRTDVEQDENNGQQNFVDPFFAQVPRQKLLVLLFHIFAILFQLFQLIAHTLSYRELFLLIDCMIIPHLHILFKFFFAGRRLTRPGKRGMIRVECKDERSLICV